MESYGPFIPKFYSITWKNFEGNVREWFSSWKQRGKNNERIKISTSGKSNTIGDLTEPGDANANKKVKLGYAGLHTHTYIYISVIPKKFFLQEK